MHVTLLPKNITCSVNGPEGKVQTGIGHAELRWLLLRATFRLDASLRGGCVARLAKAVFEAPGRRSLYGVGLLLQLESERTT